MRQIILISIPVVFLGALLLFVFTIRGTGTKAAACDIGSCPLELHGSDTGKTFVYRVGAKFKVVLDGRINPRNRLSCSPRGIIAPIESDVDAEPPMYVANFEGIEHGECDLTNNEFQARIVIRETAQ